MWKRSKPRGRAPFHSPGHAGGERERKEEEEEEEEEEGWIVARLSEGSKEQRTILVAGSTPLRLRLLGQASLPPGPRESRWCIERRMHQFRGGENNRCVSSIRERAPATNNTIELISR